MNYSNPRKSATFTDWPWGSRLRTTATFVIESTPGKGERAVRTTIDPKTGELFAPKKLTYSVRQLIADGDDGKTYILCKTIYGTISVHQSNMQFSQEHIGTDDERFPALNAMFA